MHGLLFLSFIYCSNEIERCKQEIRNGLDKLECSYAEILESKIDLESKFRDTKDENIKRQLDLKQRELNTISMRINSEKAKLNHYLNIAS